VDCARPMTAHSDILARMTEPSRPLDPLDDIAQAIASRFERERRVLSFPEYLTLFQTKPQSYARDAARYLRDAFDHYGTETVSHAWGAATRYRLFNLPWEDAAPGERRSLLVGQEHVQAEIYRALSNFVREGKPNRLILLHGPNGSAKSTIVNCILKALEHYSLADEGALYRFNWVFPADKTTRGALGFSGTSDPKQFATYAHLPDEQLDAKLLVEVRDHPLFLIPSADRRALLSQQLGDDLPSEWLARGELSHKSKQVFEALLASYKGSYRDVLKHVQVERYYISQRYRIGAVTVGPQMSVDAGERQLTADRSLGSLPASLQALTLYEAKGELIEASGGVLEFSDLLKRPLDAFKYLQHTVESQTVQLTQQNVQLNCVMLGSANELHLDAFRQHPEYASFRGRLELVRAPYLRSHLHEQSIYDAHVAPQVTRHVAPHATAMAAKFAVLTRMRKPNADRIGGKLGELAATLTAWEKLELYGAATIPGRFTEAERQTLRGGIRKIYEERDELADYEGRVGASPREIRVLLLDAAQSREFTSLSPLAVLHELEALSARANEFEWLQIEAESGGYHDAKAFREQLHEHLMDCWETELYSASGLVEEEQYDGLLGRYVEHVSVWVKRERIRNRATGAYDEPDEAMMREVEQLLGLGPTPEESRRTFISSIAAWAIDHPGQPILAPVVFPNLVVKLRAAVFARKRDEVIRLANHTAMLLREEGQGLDESERKAAELCVTELGKRYGYTRDSAADLVSQLLRVRFRPNASH
jgi:serine protein kinase